ncbi:MAG: HAMP domain-containing histidine kinase [Salinivirgaceae bacterium]|nr:HAMP domain-containing histidine kinase [Salinivirgaceae bacterium]
MKKQRFSGILALMIISLFGIIAVQIIWVRKAISVRDEQFAQHVNHALQNAAYRIERNQNAFWISNFMSGWRGKARDRQEESLIMSLSDFSRPRRTEHVIDLANVKTEKKGDTEITTYSIDTLFDNGSVSFQAYSSVTKPDGDNDRSRINDILEQMLFEFNIKDRPIEERIDFSVIKPTLTFELRNAGIELPFEFAVTDSKGKPLQPLASKGYKRQKHTFCTSLFPNDIAQHDEMLSVYFPDRRNALYGSVMLPISASVLFTIIILITFWVTIRTMVDQKRISEVKTDFVNNMTHEFKTPLATIQLAADSIASPSIIAEPEKVKRFVGIIKEENRRMNRQVESVLQMSMLDKKDFNLNLQPTHIKPIVETAVGNISLQVEHKNGTIKFTDNSTNDYVKVDQSHFINVIYNLLDNANKYSLDAPPDITVTMRNIGTDLLISVSDKGIGMDKETQEKVFDKFYRHPTGNVHTVKGFGLGLSYVKAIVLSCKGEIKVSSQKGQGSTFEIWLPVLNEISES